MSDKKQMRTPLATVEKLVISFDDCPRCGDTHEELEVWKFSRAGAIQGYDYRDQLTAGWSWWAECPIYEEPVLLNVDLELEPVPAEEG